MSKLSSTVATIGPNTSTCTPEIYSFGLELGRLLADMGFTILNGGRGGFMEAVFKGARQSRNYTFGQCIGILPGADAAEANAFCDIKIPTGIGLARNAIVANSSDIVIAVGGGSGTLSELAYAWQFQKTIICFAQFGGWAAELAGKQLDNRHQGEIAAMESLEELKEWLKANI
jgi:uncharacterized protein (TIGR00725 family)